MSPRKYEHCRERQQQEIERVLGAPDQFLDETLLTLMGNKVRPERRKSLRCRFGGQTLGRRAELLQQRLGLRGRGVGQPPDNRCVAMVVG